MNFVASKLLQQGKGESSAVVVLLEKREASRLLHSIHALDPSARLKYFFTSWNWPALYSSPGDFVLDTAIVPERIAPPAFQLPELRRFSTPWDEPQTNPGDGDADDASATKGGGDTGYDLESQQSNVGITTERYRDAVTMEAGNSETQLESLITTDSPVGSSDKSKRMGRDNQSQFSQTNYPQFSQKASQPQHYSKRETFFAFAVQKLLVSLGKVYKGLCPERTGVCHAMRDLSVVRQRVAELERTDENVSASQLTMKVYAVRDNGRVQVRDSTTTPIPSHGPPCPLPFHPLPKCEVKASSKQNIMMTTTPRSNAASVDAAAVAATAAADDGDDDTQEMA